MIWGAVKEAESHGVGVTGNASNPLLLLPEADISVKARILEQTNAPFPSPLLSLPSSLPSSLTLTKRSFQSLEMGNPSGPAYSCCQGVGPGTFLSPTTVRSMFILPISLSKLRAVFPPTIHLLHTQTIPCHYTITSSSWNSHLMADDRNFRL